MKFSDATLTDVLQHLNGVKGGGNQYYAKCPAHDDKNASLSVTESGGKVLLKCHAGCSFESIVSAMGFELGGTEKPARSVVAEYEYRDKTGKLLFVKVRFAPKDFRIKRPDNKGGWIWDAKGIEKVLYRLPELIEAVKQGRPIFIPEGEKDCLTLVKYGFEAACNFDGAGATGKWLDSYNQYFTGANVYIIQDNDDPGKKHAHLVADNLLPVAKSVYVIDLTAISPGLPEHGDISDFFSRAVDKGAALKEFTHLLAGVSPYTKTEPKQAQEQTQEPDKGHKLVTVSADDLQAQKLAPLRFVVEDMLPQGLSLLASPPKYGKSWLVLHLCLCVADGTPFLGHETYKGGCLYLALEDSFHRLQDRMNKVLDGGKAPKGFDYAIAAEDLSNGLVNQLAAYIKDKPDTSLIVIDTLQKVRAVSSGRENAYSADYREVGALKKFADEHRICLLLVHHLRKAADDTDVFNRISGTNGIMGAVDTAMVLSKAKRTDTETTLSITGRDIDASETVLTFDKSTFQWHVVGTAEDRAEEKAKQEYRSDPLVETVRRVLAQNPIGWSGTASDLFQACVELSGYYPTEGPVGIGRKLKTLAPLLYKYDLILYKAPNKNGGVNGRNHTFLNKAEKELTPFEA